MVTYAQKYPQVFQLELNYDDSDSQSDYFNGAASFGKAYFLGVMAKSRITEKQLRDQLPRLPRWIRFLGWSYTNDYPYHQGTLVSDPLDVTVDTYNGGNSRLWFTISTTSKSIFNMNNKESFTDYPKSIDDIRSMVEARNEKDREGEAYRKTSAYKQQQREQEVKLIQSSSAVIDGRGFVDIRSPEAKQAEIDRVTIGDKVDRWFPDKKPTDWKNFTLDL